MTNQTPVLSDIDQSEARNQFDMMEDLPGGLEGLRGAVDRFHHHGVRVLLSYNPWDQGTRCAVEDFLLCIISLFAVGVMECPIMKSL